MVSQEMRQNQNKEIDEVFIALDNLCREKRKGNSEGKTINESLSSVREIYHQHPPITLEDYSNKMANATEVESAGTGEIGKSENLILEQQNSETYEPESTYCSFQCENLDEELRNVKLREMIKNVENEINGEKTLLSESHESENLLYTEIEVPDLEMNKSYLPTTQQFLDDFYLFSSRPSFLSVSQTVNPTFNSINTRNLYNGKNLIFSKTDTLSKEFKFRAPGAPLTTRPIVTPLSSILTETSIFHYINVSVKNSDTNWFVLKELNDSDKLIPYHSDEELNQIILTDIVTEIFKRNQTTLFTTIEL